MKKTIKNAQMNVMLTQLTPLLSRRDKLGYIAARNYRKLSDCLTEYISVRNSLIEKYGEKVKEESGALNFRISVDSENFPAFCNELGPFNEIEHEIELMTAKYEDVVGVLTGEEILGVEWMLEE